MSHYKFVVAVTGSIAAYKSCDLVSQLVKQGHQVKVVMSKTALKFVGSATLEALSKNKVYIDDFSENSLMAHIELGKWCDATIVYPTTAQTLNSFASGTGHELLHSYYLAYDFSKPFVVFPAMNTRMYEHPVTQESIKKLDKIGCKVFPTDSGTLACGEVGAGRLLESTDAINKTLSLMGQPKKKVNKVLITAGGTRETIDGVRTLTNMSTGKTGAALADYLHEQGHQVLLLTSRFGVTPKTDVKVDHYESFREIYNTLKALGQIHSFDMILHAAAISDYSIEGIQTPAGDILPSQSKMSSQFDNISIQLKRNEKILPRLKDLFRGEPTVVGFKLTSTESKDEQVKAIFSLFTENAVDYVVHNDMNDINQGMRKYLMTSKTGQQQELESTTALASHISKLIEPQAPEVSYDLMS
ncbi:MAG: bifunctional phosphopantothenoylcysteine decarboxylase/phosphopantothenate--cysteine ligase CoaBC [Bdellovibrionales bacterium]|nr:bifunctional phosphopantothenoylcysteine decarboxylase/phosphopantothenate--cysteine ligase CoaBC [Bdellovibrionales bacterium]